MNCYIKAKLIIGIHPIRILERTILVNGIRKKVAKAVVVHSYRDWSWQPESVFVIDLPTMRVENTLEKGPGMTYSAVPEKIRFYRDGLPSLNDSAPRAAVNFFYDENARIQVTVRLDARGNVVADVHKDVNVDTVTAVNDGGGVFTLGAAEVQDYRVLQRLSPGGSTPESSMVKRRFPKSWRDSHSLQVVEETDKLVLWSSNGREDHIQVLTKGDRLVEEKSTLFSAELNTKFFILSSSHLFVIGDESGVPVLVVSELQSLRKRILHLPESQMLKSNSHKLQGFVTYSTLGVYNPAGQITLIRFWE